MDVTLQRDRIMVKPTNADVVTKAGIWLPEGSRMKATIGEVVVKGPEVRSLNLGDEIVFNNYSGVQVTIDKEQRLLLTEADVLAKVRAA